jgi:hypothetical protein
MERQLRRAVAVSGLYSGGRTPGRVFGRCERPSVRTTACAITTSIDVKPGSRWRAAHRGYLSQIDSPGALSPGGPKHLPDDQQRDDQQHGDDRAPADAVHSNTSYSKATPSGSFSSNHFSAASTFANTLMCSPSPTCLLVLSSASPNGDPYGWD